MRDEVKVEVRGSFRAQLEQFQRAAPGAIATRVLDTFDGLLSAARARWPVRTGKSRAGLFDYSEVRGDAVRLAIGNRQSYWTFIRSYQNGLRGKSPFVELIRAPGTAKVRALASDVARGLDDASPGGA